MVRTRAGYAYDEAEPDKPWPIEMPLPQPVIYYCIKNGIPNIISKLLRTCRFLFFKFEHLRIALLRLMSYNDGCRQRWRASSKEFDNCKTINLMSPYKYWLCEKVDLFSQKPVTAAKILVPKIYRCEITFLKLRYQILTFEEYKILTSSETIETFHASHTVVKSDESNRAADIPFMKILDPLKNAKSIEV